MQKEQLIRLLNNPALINSGTVDQLKSLVEEHPSFQMAWLLYVKNLKQIKSPKFEAVLKEVAVRVSDRKLLYKFLNTNFHKKHTTTDVSNDIPVNYELDSTTKDIGGNRLIDKFLSDNPGLIKQGVNEGSFVSSALLKEVVENSTSENDEIITETLANILFQQKNYEKAQDAYRKLSLKYPEKSVYFAARIKEIEVLKNNN